MLLSRANLAASALAGRDPGDAALNQLWLEPGGATAASDGRALMAVGPVGERPGGFPDFAGEEAAEGVLAGEGGFGIVPDVVAQAMRDMPRGALGLELGFAALTRAERGRGGVELTTTNLNRHLRVEGKKGRQRFPDWRAPLREAGLGNGGVRVCVDRKALARLLAAFDSAAPDPENLLFLEVAPGDAGLVLRARNAATGQAVVGLAMPVNVAGHWLAADEWEAGVFGARTAKRAALAPARVPG